MSEQARSETIPQSRLVVRAVLRTDVGLVRSENQDFGAYTSREEERVSNPGGRLLIVADGMGGHRGGATASRLAAETVKSQYLGSDAADIPTALRDSLIRANARIFSEAQANPDLRGMGTTTSVLALRDGLAWLAHVGDSRIYIVRDGEIRQLTDDHSLVATMVREGLLTPAEAESHPRRNVLQRSMGVSEDVEVDVRGPFELRAGDTFVLCSDGLHGLVKEPELREIAAKPIEEAADEYLKRALQRGAPDNVTVIVARVEQAPDEAGEEKDPLLTDDTLVDTAHPLDETHPVEPPIAASADDTVPLAPRLPVSEPRVAVVAPATSDGVTPVQQAVPAVPPSLTETTMAPLPKWTMPLPATAPAAALEEEDTQPLPPLREPYGLPRDTIEAKPGFPLPQARPTPIQPPVAAQQSVQKKSARGALGWMLLIIVLSAAGAWLYWNQPVWRTPRVPAPAQSSSQ